MQGIGKEFRAREILRRRYRPARVRILFVGEAPPASGRFFYQADSGLYRAVRDGFAKVFPETGEHTFLSCFKQMGCYLVDLCGKPVDRLPTAGRRKARQEGEVRLSRILKQLNPEAVIAVARSISGNVQRAQHLAHWSGSYLELPYPGRWQRHRIIFQASLAVALRKTYHRREVTALFERRTPV